MCFFRKKKTVAITINSKYHVDDFVKFRHRGELDPGVIANVKLGPSGEVLYDIQIGGECPITVENVPEKDVILKR